MLSGRPLTLVTGQNVQRPLGCIHVYEGHSCPRWSIHLDKGHCDGDQEMRLKAQLCGS